MILAELLLSSGLTEISIMQDAMAIAIDESKSEDERVTALDDMELVSGWLTLPSLWCVVLNPDLFQLIESLDNANGTNT